MFGLIGVDAAATVAASVIASNAIAVVAVADATAIYTDALKNVNVKMFDKLSSKWHSRCRFGLEFTEIKSIQHIIDILRFIYIHNTSHSLLKQCFCSALPCMT